MFSKYQIENSGGKAGKDTDDKGLDDRRFKLFYKKFLINKANQKQVQKIQ